MKHMMIALASSLLLLGCPEEKKDGGAKPASTAAANTAAPAASAKPAADKPKAEEEGGW